MKIVLHNTVQFSHLAHVAKYQAIFLFRIEPNTFVGNGYESLLNTERNFEKK